MVSFSVTPQGTIKVKPIQKGKIIYKFKGMRMHPEEAEVVFQKNNKLTVKKISDGELMDFINIKERWLSEKHCSSKSLLYGTEFCPDEQLQDRKENF